MVQATTEWLSDAHGCWIGCTKEGEVVYRDDGVRSTWEADDRDIVLDAKRFISNWAKFKRVWTETYEADPQDEYLESLAVHADRFKAQAAQAIDEAYTTF